jgi:hypothetical protein
MKEPKFIRRIRARLLLSAIVPDYIEGVNQACNEMAAYYAQTPLLNPAQVGYKRITPIREGYERRLQELADELSHERERNAKYQDWEKQLGEIEEESGKPFAKLIQSLRSKATQAQQQLAVVQKAAKLGMVLPSKGQVSARHVRLQEENLRLSIENRELKAKLAAQPETTTTA